MSSLLALPNEMLDPIIAHSDIRALKALRAACRRLYLRIGGRFVKHINLTTHASQLKALRTFIEQHDIARDIVSAQLDCHRMKPFVDLQHIYCFDNTSGQKYQRIAAQLDVIALVSSLESVLIPLENLCKVKIKGYGSKDQLPAYVIQEAYLAGFSFITARKADWWPDQDQLQAWVMVVMCFLLALQKAGRLNQGGKLVNSDPAELDFEDLLGCQFSRFASTTLQRLVSINHPELLWKELACVEGVVMTGCDSLRLELLLSSTEKHGELASISLALARTLVTTTCHGSTSCCSVSVNCSCTPRELHV